MRSIWNGTIAFGMVSVPVKLFSATEDHELVAHQVHAHDGGKIRYHKVCEACDEKVSAGDIAKRFEVEGQVATLTDDDLANLPSAASRVIEVVEFIPADTIQPIMIDKSYYLGPADSGASIKPYALLARTLAASNRVAVVKFTLRSKSRLAALSVTGKAEILTLHALRWPDEIREPELPSLDSAVLERKRGELTEAELNMAASVVDSMSREASNLDGYRDEFREELRELVMSKLEDAPEDVEEVSDLLAALEQSVKARAQEPAKGSPAPVAVAMPENSGRRCMPIRDWAKSEGLRVSSRGRIPKDVVDRYEKAMA